MKLEALQALEARAMKEVVKRRALGAYSMEAEGVLEAFEIILRLTQHIIETYPKDRADRVATKNAK